MHISVKARHGALARSLWKALDGTPASVVPPALEEVIPTIVECAEGGLYEILGVVACTAAEALRSVLNALPLHLVSESGPNFVRARVERLRPTAQGLSTLGIAETIPDRGAETVYAAVNCARQHIFCLLIPKDFEGLRVAPVCHTE
jgi:hypothetical protein